MHTNHHDHGQPGKPNGHGGGKGEHGCQGEYVAVAVYTPQGSFPNDEDYRRVPADQPISVILGLAAAHFKLTNTSDWVATIDDKEVAASTTYQGLKSCCFVEIDWHKREGGGGE